MGRRYTRSPDNLKGSNQSPFLMGIRTTKYGWSMILCVASVVTSRLMELESWSQPAPWLS